MLMAMSDAMFAHPRMLLFIFRLPRRRRCLLRLAQFPLEAAFDARVFLVGFDLFDFEWDTEPLRKIAFGDRVIASFGCAAVEVLVIPEVWRRDCGARLPINLHRLVRLFWAVLSPGREPPAL